MLLAGGAVEQLIDLGGAVAEAEQRLAGERRRIVGAGDRDRVLGQRRADLLAQLDDDPLGGALADPGRRLQPGRIAGGDDR